MQLQNNQKTKFPAIFYYVCTLIILLFGRLNTNVTKQKLLSLIRGFNYLFTHSFGHYPIVPRWQNQRNEFQQQFSNVYLYFIICMDFYFV